MHVWVLLYTMQDIESVDYELECVLCSRLYYYIHVAERITSQKQFFMNYMYSCMCSIIDNIDYINGIGNCSREQ